MQWEKNNCARILHDYVFYFCFFFVTFAGVWGIPSKDTACLACHYRCSRGDFHMSAFKPIVHLITADSYSFNVDCVRTRTYSLSKIIYHVLVQNQKCPESGHFWFWTELPHWCQSVFGPKCPRSEIGMLKSVIFRAVKNCSIKIWLILKNF